MAEEKEIKKAVTKPVEEQFKDMWNDLTIPNETYYKLDYQQAINDDVPFAVEGALNELSEEECLKEVKAKFGNQLAISFGGKQVIGFIQYRTSLEVECFYICAKDRNEALCLSYITVETIQKIWNESKEGK